MASLWGTPDEPLAIEALYSTFDYHDRAVTANHHFPAAAVHPKEPLLVSSCAYGGGTIQVYQVATKGFLKQGSLKRISNLPLPSVAHELKFDALGLLATQGVNKISRFATESLRDKPTASFTYTAEFRDHPLTAGHWTAPPRLAHLSTSPFGPIAATRGRAVYIWDPSREEPVRELPLTTSPVLATAWSSFDPSVFASAEQGAIISVFDLRSQNPLILEAASPVRAAQFSPFARHILASADQLGSVQLWDIRQPLRPMETLEIPCPGRAGCLDWSPSHPEQLVVGGVDGTINVFDVLDQDCQPLCCPGKSVESIFSLHDQATLDSIAAARKQQTPGSTPRSTPRPGTQPAPTAPAGVLCSTGYTRTSPGQIFAAYSDGTIHLHSASRAFYERLAGRHMSDDEDIAAELRNVYIGDLEGVLTSCVARVTSLLSGSSPASTASLSVQMSEVAELFDDTDEEGLDRIDALCLRDRRLPPTLCVNPSPQTKATFDCIVAAAHLASAIDMNDQVSMDRLQPGLIALVSKASRPLFPFVESALERLVSRRLSESIDVATGLLLQLPEDIAMWGPLSFRAVLPSTVHGMSAQAVRVVLSTFAGLIKSTPWTSTRCLQILAAFDTFEPLPPNSKQTAVLNNELSGDAVKRSLRLQAELFHCLHAGEDAHAVLNRAGDAAIVGVRVLYAVMYSALAIRDFYRFIRLTLIDSIKMSQSMQSTINQIRDTVMWPLLLTHLQTYEADEARTDGLEDLLIAVSKTVKACPFAVSQELQGPVSRVLRLLTIRAARTSRDLGTLTVLLGSPGAAGGTRLEGALAGMLEILEQAQT